VNDNFIKKNVFVAINSIIIISFKNLLMIFSMR